MHDPTVAKKWREEQLEPALQQFRQGFTTQKSQEWANKFVNTQREHFFSKTEADMSSMAGIAVRESLNNAVTKYSNAAVSDPSSVDTSVKIFKQGLDDVIAANPNIKGPDAARIRLEVAEKGARQIVQAGAMGAILNSGDPEAAATAWAKKYPDYVSGAEELQLGRAAKTQARANLAYAKQAQAYDVQIQNAKVAQASKDLFQQNVTKDTQGNVTLAPQFFKDLMNMPLQYPRSSTVKDVADTYLRWGEKMQSGPATATEPQTDADLTNRMFAADKPTTELDIRKAEAAGKMDPKYGDTLIDVINARDSQPIKNPQFGHAIDTARGMIEGPTPMTRAAATGRYASFLQAFLPEYMRQLNAGTLKPNALNLSDPESLISQTLSGYRMGLGQIIRSNGGVGSTPQANM